MVPVNLITLVVENTCLHDEISLLHFIGFIDDLH